MNLPAYKNWARDTELLDAYRELWVAVENGELEEKFFELRERFRNTVQKGVASE